MKKLLYPFAACAAFLCGCSSEETAMVSPDSQRHDPILVRAASASLTLSTRAGYDENNLPSTLYFSIDQDGDNFDYGSVVLTNNGSGAYTPKGDMLWADRDHSDASIRVWNQPGSTTSITGVSTLTLTTDQSTEAGLLSADMVGCTTANGGVTISGNTVNLSLKHLFSKVIFRYTSTDASLTPQRFYLNGVPSTGSFDYDAVSFTEVSSSSIDTVQAFVGEFAEGEALIEAILFPCTFTASNAPGVSFYIEGMDRPFIATLPSCTLEAGKAYSFDLSIDTSGGSEEDTNEELVLGTATLVAWDEQKQEDPVGMVPVVPEAVDLGLSVKWATFNIGADFPEEYGDYFAWGETATKSTYTSDNSTTYGLSTTELQSRGIVGSDGNLTAAYDAAIVNWGGSWRMPTKDEMDELINNCTWTWITLNGVNGYQVSGNGNFIFLPAAGYRYGASLYYAGSYGYYWSATPYSDSFRACYLLFDSDYYYWYSYYRYYGLAVRPVSE